MQEDQIREFKQLTDEHKANLDKLATYLENLPEEYENFGMSQFLRPESYVDLKQRFPDQTYFGLINKYARENGGVSECGSVACAVGHGPSAGILFPESMINTYNSFRFYAGLVPADAPTPDWGGYTDKFFCDRDGLLFEWMFGGDWSYVDDTHRGAAARIRYVLAQEEIPDEFEDSSECTEEMVELYQEYVIEGDAHIKPKTPA